MAKAKAAQITRAELLKQIKSILALNSVTEVKEEDITESANLVEDIGFDVLDHMELAMELEEKYGIEISDEDMDEDAVKSVADVLTMLERKLKGKAA